MVVVEKHLKRYTEDIYEKDSAHNPTKRKIETHPLFWIGTGDARYR